MYTPEDFAENDLARLHKVIRENGFALLLTAVEGRTAGTIFSRRV